MKTKTLIRSLVVCAVAGAIFDLNAQTTVTIDPNAAWIGYMNVSDLPAPAGDGAFQFGSSWGTADLTAVFSGSTLTLGPNAINDPATYWYVGGGAPGAAGNKNMDANMYVEDNTLAGQTVTFTAHTLSDTLSGTLPPYYVDGVAPYTCVAFIKDFVADYSSFTSTTIALTPGSDFSISLLTSPGDHVQYGFETIGPNVWATDVGLAGTVVLTPVIVPEPSTLALAGLSGLAGLSLIRRRK